MAVFKDLKVIELASVLAGPSVGQFFAELGATVVKIENSETGGDVTRSWKSAQEKTDSRSAYFSAINWGKQSISLNLKNENDKIRFFDLLTDADVLLISFKPGDAEKLGVTYDACKRINEKVIYAAITGYGNRDTRVGYDAVIQAESGFMSMNGEPEGNSLKMPVALIDLLAGHQVKEGVLVSLFERQRSGIGCKVEVSLFDSALASLANQATNFLMAGKTPGKQGSLHPNIAPYGEVVKTKDGSEILLALGSDKQFQHLLKLLKLDTYVQDERFVTNEKRVTNRKEMFGLLSHAFLLFDAAEILPQLHELKIPAGKINTVAQALQLPQASALLLDKDGCKAIRTFVAQFSNEDLHPVTDLTSPPLLPK
ncbi:MAG: CaiB/BaiF CoA transferase family protein [Chryseotalea sp.]|jgi:crotonobetainyl-CoA:carnitine CoA-transferase CaiB-like acyl-CoA transferase